MKYAHNMARRRNAFTLIELLVVMVLILVLAALGLGYIVFGQDNQHSVSGAQAITGALLNAKQHARRDGLPTGVRIIFQNLLDSKGNPILNADGNPFVFGSQLQLIQQPEDYNAGQVATTGANQTTIQFSAPLTGAVDFQGGAQYPGQIDESTVQAGDYFLLTGVPPVHKIIKVYNSALGNPSAAGNTPTIDLASPVQSVMSGAAYSIIRAPRRLPSEDVIQLPPSVVIDNTLAPAPSGFTYCQNIPTRYLVDSMTPPASPGTPVSEIVFAPSGAVVGQGTGADKVYLWLRDPSLKLTPTAGKPLPGVPLLLSVQIRTGLIGVYPVAPWTVGTPIAVGNDPYAYVKDPRSLGTVNRVTP